MNNYNLALTLGVGTLTAFFLFFVFFKIFHWSGKMASVATAALMLLIYVPLAAMHWVSIDVFAIHFAFFMMVPYGLGIITSVHEERKLREGVTELKTGMHWIPGIIIVFFILLATVDSIIITFATSGVDGKLAKLILPESISGDAGEGLESKFTGNVAYDLQDEEERFDLYVKQLQQQKLRGWEITGGWVDTKPVLNQDSLFQLTIKDKAGQTIEGAKVNVDFLRSSKMSADQNIVLLEKEQGVYGNTVALAEPGCWKMHIIISRGSEEHVIRGDSEVAEMIDGRRIKRECIDGEPEMDSAL